MKIIILKKMILFFCLSLCCLSTVNSQIKVESTGKTLFGTMPGYSQENTEIKYAIPENAKDAFVYVFDMQGSLLKKLPLIANQGFVAVNGSELKAGMYLYSLVVDGKTLDTKRMILTK